MHNPLYTLILIMMCWVFASSAGAGGPFQDISNNMVFVKGGCFEMGDQLGEGLPNERPVHRVCLDDYYLGKFEVTVGEFRAFVEDTGYSTEAEWQDGCHSWIGSREAKRKEFSWRNTNFDQTDRNPVVCISWNDAYHYMSWLNRETGKNYRLPTEAEWEYAARSRGKTYRFSWGNGNPSGNIADRGAYSELLGKNSDIDYYDGYVFSAPVGSFTPNVIGIYDMSGNVSEWISDYYNEKYYSSSPRINPVGPKNGTCRVIRGGTWNPVAPVVRTTTRLCSIPGGRGSWMGFRLAHSAGP